MGISSILIIGGKPGTFRQTARAPFKVTYVDDAGDAAAMVRDDEIFQLAIITLSKTGPAVLPLCNSLLEATPPAKVMLVAGDDELQEILSWLAGLTPGDINSFTRSTAPLPEKEKPVTSALPSRFEGLIGESPEMKKVKTLIEKIAPTGTTILLQGESGTGKEVLARAIHRSSARSDRPFIPVDCAAISGTIIESELFGHAKGAFTGADRSTLGMIRSADKGTLFLDEIGELPMNMQAKLLRTLQERAVKPVGESRIYPVDIRIIAATNRNLAEGVKNGEFREDLYYRLNAITIYAPPLRERASDIPLICRHILNRLENEGFTQKTISERALTMLSTYGWPGNVRELENVMRRATMLTNGDTIDTDVLSFESGHMLALEACDVNPGSMASHEKEAIQKALQKTSGNRRAAADLLGISEATLYRRLKAYSI
jgi:two-component system response regulator HydG